MPKVNGHKPAGSVETPEYQLAAKMLIAFRDTWNEQLKVSGADPVMFSRLSVVALSQLSAIVAVDVGMQHDQFTNVCRANFDEAFKNAPRFSA